MPAALHQTFADLTRTLVEGTVPKSKIVMQGDKRVGWLRHDTFVSMFTGRAVPVVYWGCDGTHRGSADTEAEALACIEAGLLECAEWADADRRREAEIAALPEPLRTLRIEVENANVRLEIERHRNVVRVDDLDRAERRHREAVMAYEAAERGLAEAA